MVFAVALLSNRISQRFNQDTKARTTIAIFEPKDNVKTISLYTYLSLYIMMAFSLSF